MSHCAKLALPGEDLFEDGAVVVEVFLTGRWNISRDIYVKQSQGVGEMAKGQSNDRRKAAFKVQHWFELRVLYGIGSRLI